MRSLQIAFFGSSLVSAYWNGAATYYRGIIRALARRGHRVTFYEPDIYGRQQNRDIEDPSWATVEVYRPEVSDLWRALESAKNADLLVKTSGIGIFDDLLEDAVPQAASPHTMTAFWDVDAPATLERLAENLNDAFRCHIPKYDAIFTYGGGPKVVREYTLLGARSCTPIYNALDPDEHFPVASEPRFAADLSLLANRLPDREKRIDDFFFGAASLAEDCDFLMGGNGWNDKHVPSNVRKIGHVFTRDHNAFNCSARIVLNVNRQSMASYGFSPPTRVFEAAGAGACIVTDSWAGIEHFLEPDREILVADDGATVAEIVRTLPSGRAREIGERARKRILAGHTYEDRVDEVERLLCLHSKFVSKIYPEVNTAIPVAGFNQVR